MASQSYDGAENRLTMPGMSTYNGNPAHGLTSTPGGHHPYAANGNAQTATNRQGAHHVAPGDSIFPGRVGGRRSSLSY